MKYQIKEIKNKFDQDFCAANAALKKSVHTGIQKKMIILTNHQAITFFSNTIR